MRVWIAVMALVAGPALAESWSALDGAGIEAALVGRSLDYGNATQDFRASGRTDYFSGRPSSGRWEVRGDQYCSVWPPSETWSCFDVDASADAKQIRFRGESGDETVGTYIDR